MAVTAIYCLTVMCLEELEDTPPLTEEAGAQFATIFQHGQGNATVLGPIDANSANCLRSFPAHGLLT